MPNWHQLMDYFITDYFKRFDMEKTCRCNVTSFGIDKLGFHIYETHKITRFTYFHPIHNSEAFFFNVLLRTIPFINENDLLSATNIEKSYIRECHNRGIISNVDIIQEYLLQYAHCNLIDTKKQSQLLEQLLEDYPYMNPEHIPQDIHVSTPSSNAERIHTKWTPTHIDHVFDIDIAYMVLTEEQQYVMDNILQNPHGLHILTCTPGSEKMFFCEIHHPILSKAR